MKIYNSFFKHDKSELYSCLRITMRICRWFGVFCVEGLNSDSISGLKYKFRTFYTIYNILTILGQAWSTVIALVRVTEEINYNTILNFTLSFAGFTSSIFLLKLAREWPVFISKIADIETCLMKIETTNSILRIKITALVILLLGLVEHILCNIFYINLAMKCLGVDEKVNVVELFYTIRYSYGIHYAPLNILIAIIAEITNKQSTFLWTFTDVFIISVNMYLTSYFEDLNKVIDSQKNKINTNWAQLREHYCNLVLLLKEIDLRIRAIVLQSLSSNLLFVLVQLYKTLNIIEYSNEFCDITGFREAMHGAHYYVYYSYSFLFLLTRTLALSVTAANVHTVAQKPLSALNEVHFSLYNIEVQRFRRQIFYQTIAISGIFFHITRQMILKVVGTLITYELVMVQFTNPTPAEHSVVDFGVNNSYHRSTDGYY